jgi:hypothetical protein
MSKFSISGEVEMSPQKAAFASLTASRQGSLVSLDKLRVKSDGRLLAELSLKLSSSSKMTISTEDGRQEPGKPLHSVGKLGLEMALPNLNADMDIDVVNGPLVHGSLLYKYGNIRVGGEALVNTHAEDKDQTVEFADMNFGMSYSGLDWTLIARTTNSLENMRVGYLHNFSPALVLVSQVDYHLKSNAQKIAFGSKYM